MRLISQSDISKLYQEKIENIIKDYCDSYADKAMVSSNNGNTNSTQVNCNSNGINLGYTNINEVRNLGNSRDQIINGNSGDNININSLELEGKNV